MAQIASSAGHRHVGWMYRVQVLLRLVAAVACGYALSAAFAAAVGLVGVRWWGMAKADAVMLGTMLSFVVFAVVALWVFACRSTRRVYAELAVATAVCGALAWVLYQGVAA